MGWGEEKIFYQKLMTHFDKGYFMLRTAQFNEISISFNLHVCQNTPEMVVINSFRQENRSVFEKHVRKNLLDSASQGGNVAITEIMLSPCLDINSQDSNGDSVDDQGSCADFLITPQC